MKMCSINPCSSGFGEYQCSEFQEVCEEELDDVLRENIIFELGKDNLPDDLEDIRGLIHFQPARIFAKDCGEECKNINGDMGKRYEYFGIEE